ncbi:hypothetical protein H3S74_00840 [Gilliamella sp. W8126]|uniref:hypothetical protein n=1 Tax=Gilliamella sp. W8126 TaxID=2750946 RepID=UPI0018DDCCA7|nr:hypothetical protein [Gilliamella sp. W8126]MBI0004780.1 hypothetical protein [Gilliamella sp. W8126]
MVGNIITKFYNNMMKKLYLLIIFFFLFYSSKSAIAEQKTIDVNPIKETSVVPEKNTQSQYISYEMVKNLSLDDALEKFPSYEKETYILGTDEGPITEFRIRLLIIFKPDEIEQQEIKITEITWQINAVENLTVWYHLQKEQWLPIDHYIWHKDSLF